MEKMITPIERATKWILKFPINNKKLTIDDFVSQFHDDELEAMRAINESCDSDYTYTDECDLPYAIVSDYVQGWLMEQIGLKVHDGTDHLFELYKMLCW